MKPRPIPLSIALIAATVALGLALRMAPLGLPGLVMKYGGSAMWALMIYWLLTTVFPALAIPVSVIIAGGIATAVEFFKLYRSPDVDAFRATLAGMLLLGRYFAWRDILAYWMAIAAGGLLDRAIRSARH